MKFNFDKLDFKSREGIDVQPIFGIKAEIKKDEKFNECDEFLEKEITSYVMKYEENKSLFHDGGSMARIYEFLYGNQTYLIKEQRNTSEIKNGFIVNDPSEEILIQNNLFDIGVRVPMPMVYINVSIKDFKNKRMLERKLILMEKIDGLSVGDQYRRFKQGASPLLPFDFSVDQFMVKLKKEIDLMHNNDFYHRDLTLNNILIDKKGDPVVIDFGSSVNTSFDPYSMHETVVIKNGKRTIVGASEFKDDNAGLASISEALKEMVKF